MPAYHTFTRTGVTPPDLAALVTSLRTTVDPMAGCQPVSSNTITVKIGADAWTPAQIAAAQTAIDIAPAATAQRTAQTAIDQFPIEYKALVLALIDALNVVRAALPSPLPPVTPAQAIAAIRTKAGTL